MEGKCGCRLKIAREHWRVEWEVTNNGWEGFEVWCWKGMMNEDVQLLRRSVRSDIDMVMKKEADHAMSCM